MRFNLKTIFVLFGSLSTGCAAQSPAGPGLSAVTPMVAAGGGHTCMLSARGRLQCWGANNSGQVGIGESNPTQILTLPSTIPGFGDVDQTADISLIIDQVVTGMWHTCVRTRSKAVWCWGWNGQGQLGDDSLISRPKPSAVPGLSGVRALAAGAGHTCAITGGAVSCWGYNSFGQLGNGTNLNQPSPVAVSGISIATMIVAGRNHTCALVSGGVQCWGSNQYGQLGDGSTTSSSSPVAVTGLSSGVVAITSGGDHSCALLSGGSVKCWGRNQVGQLGNGTVTYQQTTAVAVSGITTATQIAAGYWHTCALLKDGTVDCWGYSLHGEIGSGQNANSNTPLAVTGVSGASAISTGWWHSCANLASGQLLCWGRNESGQLGDGTNTTRNSAGNVVGY